MAEPTKEQPAELPKRPSFIGSVMSGIGGWIKGALSGGLVGALGGALVGAIVGGVGLALATGAAPLTLAAGAIAVGLSAATGAGIGAAALGAVGAVAGTVTGVVRSREAGQPSAEDVVNVAKISFAQGVAVGHNIEHAAHTQGNKHTTKVTTDRAAMAMAERQIVN